MKLNNAQKSVLVITVGFMLLYFIFRKAVFLYAAGGVCIPGFSSARLGEKIHWIWMKLALILGTINSFILLTIVYYLIVTPLGFLMRLSGKSQVLLKKPASRSTFTNRDHLFTKNDLANPW